MLRIISQNILSRELILAWANKLDLFAGIIFFIVAASLFPLTTNPTTQLLQQIALPVTMVCGLLASLLTLNQMFSQDWRDGTLEQLLLLPIPNYIVVLMKIIAHWFIIGVPLAIVAPIIALQYQLSGIILLKLALAIMLMMLSLSAIGSLTSALTLGLRQGDILLALIHLPLCFPILIFTCYNLTMPYISGWWVMAIITLSSIFFIPLLTVVALRTALH